MYFVLFAWGAHTLVDHEVQHVRVRGADERRRPRPVVVQPVCRVASVVRATTRLIAVEPCQAQSKQSKQRERSTILRLCVVSAALTPVVEAILANIAFLHRAPRVRPCCRIEEVVYVSTAESDGGLATAVEREQTFRFRLGEVGRRLCDTVRVRRDHQLHPELPELIHHGFWVGPAACWQSLISESVLPVFRQARIDPREEADIGIRHAQSKSQQDKCQSQQSSSEL
jgi:hypothetical protein